MGPAVLCNRGLWGDNLPKPGSVCREKQQCAYQLWPNGCVAAKAITRDLEQMNENGVWGVLICDIGGSNQDDKVRPPMDLISSPGKRLTRTNIRRLTSATPSMPSGLLGPLELGYLE